MRVQGGTQCAAKVGVVRISTSLYWRACMQEFCNGGALRSMLQQGALSAKHLPRHFSVVLGLVLGIACGMRHISDRGICHGDLNPSNVLLQVRPPCHCCASSVYIH